MNSFCHCMCQFGCRKIVKLIDDTWENSRDNYIHENVCIKFPIMLVKHASKERYAYTRQSSRVKIESINIESMCFSLIFNRLMNTQASESLYLQNSINISSHRHRRWCIVTCMIIDNLFPLKMSLTHFRGDH